MGNGTVYSSWNGRAYAKQYTSPSNPNTAAQNSQRVMFHFLTNAWSHIATVAKATWQEPASRTRITPANAFVSYNLDRWKNFLMPQQQFNQAITSSGIGIAFHNTSGGAGFITEDATPSTTTNIWALVVFRIATTGLAATKNACVAIRPLSDNSDVYIIEEPVPPGTYYHILQFINKDGKTGTAHQTAAITVT